MSEPVVQSQPDATQPGTLTVAISSRALFDLEDSHALFEREGIAAYSAFQRAHEDDLLAPGIAFPLVRKLLALNAGAPVGADGQATPRVEVILLSRNSSDTGLRIAADGRTRIQRQQLAHQRECDPGRQQVILVGALERAVGGDAFALEQGVAVFQVEQCTRGNRHGQRIGCCRFGLGLGDRVVHASSIDQCRLAWRDSIQPALFTPRTVRSGCVPRGCARGRTAGSRCGRAIRGW